MRVPILTTTLASVIGASPGFAQMDSIETELWRGTFIKPEDNSQRVIPTNRWFWFEISPGIFAPDPHGLSKYDLASGPVSDEELDAARKALAASIPANDPHPFWCIWLQTASGAERYVCTE